MLSRRNQYGDVKFEQKKLPTSFAHGTFQLFFPFWGSFIVTGTHEEVTSCVHLVGCQEEGLMPITREVVCGIGLMCQIGGANLRPIPILLMDGSKRLLSRRKKASSMLHGIF